ncbi:MAG: hypothetical protein JO372_04325, partial [Solirubrobacterales bacterium]|nr:hypothetical protein [Solirubrobacterales bacterium]
MQGQTFKRYLRTLREHIWLILLCTVLTTAAAAVYVELAPRKYSAQSEMLVSPVPADNSNLVGLPVLISSGNQTTDVLTAASLMTTSQVATAVINALHLNETPTALLANVQATPIGQSNLVAIQATAPSAGQAQAIANEFADQVVATRTTTLHAAISKVIPGLQSQAAGLPPAERNGPGTVGAQVAQLQQLLSSNDPTITIAAPASLPTGPSSPKKTTTLAAALFAGLIIGIGLAFLVDA